jgi:hypothetical protein
MKSFKADSCRTTGKNQAAKDKYEIALQGKTILTEAAF